MPRRPVPGSHALGSSAEGGAATEPGGRSSEPTGLPPVARPKGSAGSHVGPPPASLRPCDLSPLQVEVTASA
eukprot:10747631-Prorocentrum_lima.AAC.1